MMCNTRRSESLAYLRLTQRSMAGQHLWQSRSATSPMRLTPIRDRQEDAMISCSMREAGQKLAERVTVYVVSGRDRKVVQELLGVDTLIVAGDHGFDIWSPTRGSIEHAVDIRR